MLVISSRAIHQTLKAYDLRANRCPLFGLRGKERKKNWKDFGIFSYLIKGRK